jgi:aminopeptidase N
MKHSDGHESGPVVAGYRLNSRDTPVDYQLLVYEKGAYILHMLRMMLTDLETGDDSRFKALMRQFVRDHQQTPASTRSFEQAVTRAFGEPMDWFFDQWVYGVDIPTYRVDLDVSRVSDQPTPFLLHGTVRQDEVASGFRMPVPIVLQFDEHPPLARRIWIDADSVDVEIPLPAEPTALEFNYQHAVLAHVR